MNAFTPTGALSSLLSIFSNSDSSFVSTLSMESFNVHFWISRSNSFNFGPLHVRIKTSRACSKKRAMSERNVSVGYKIAKLIKSGNNKKSPR